MQSLSFTLDAAGNIEERTDSVETSLSQAFDYDALDRLTHEDGTYGSKAYSYDGNGNRLTRTWDDGQQVISPMARAATG